MSMKITRDAVIYCLETEDETEVHAKIDIIDYDISYEEFFKRFMFKNRPCKFSSSFTEFWESRKNWVTEDGKPNFDYFEKVFGDAVAPIANCDIQLYNSHCKEDMLVRNYISYWRHKSNNGEDMSCLYLKDWHLKRQFPDSKTYCVPIYFMSDWLNEFWDSTNKDDDYRFVYMGPKGSWTSCHADVFGSYSWSANVCGTKRWLLIPPGKENQFYDNKGNLLFDITSDIESQAKDVIEVIQTAGEIIFIPSGWHHQVWNLEDTISINHNWFNGCNIEYVCKQLHTALKQVQNEIRDCKNMDGWDVQCQVLLKAHHGMDVKDFYRLLECIGNRALSKISKLDVECDNIWHDVFDLAKVYQMVNYMANNKLLNFDSEYKENIHKYCKKLQESLEIYNLPVK